MVFSPLGLSLPLKDRVIVGELSLQLNVGATVIQSFLSSLLHSGNEKKKLKKIGKSPVKPNLPISCCFTVKASKLYQNSLHCFYGNAVFDGTGFWKSFFTCDGSVKYIPLV